MVVPFSRPKHLQNTIDNFVRQKFSNKKLILVENGPAIGACKKIGFEPDLLLTSEPHQAHAKNAGLAAIRERGGGFWATFDDDDYYGPGYLEEMVEASAYAEVVGKADFFVRMARGTLRSFQSIGCEQYVNFIHGPTICSWAEACCDFPIKRIGEDIGLVENMMGVGAKVWATSRHHFIFNRYSDECHHTWKISDDQLTHSLAFGVGPRGMAIIKDYGPKVDYDFVNGLKTEEPPFELLSTDLKCDEALEYARTHGMPFEEFIEETLRTQGMLKEGEQVSDKFRQRKVDVVSYRSFEKGLSTEIISRDD